MEELTQTVVVAWCRCLINTTEATSAPQTWGRCYSVLVKTFQKRKVSTILHIPLCT